MIREQDSDNESLESHSRLVYTPAEIANFEHYLVAFKLGVTKYLPIRSRRSLSLLISNGRYFLNVHIIGSRTLTDYAVPIGSSRDFKVLYLDWYFNCSCDFEQLKALTEGRRVRSVDTTNAQYNTP